MGSTPRTRPPCETGCGRLRRLAALGGKRSKPPCVEDGRHPQRPDSRRAPRERRSQSQVKKPAFCDGCDCAGCVMRKNRNGFANARRLHKPKVTGESGYGRWEKGAKRLPLKSTGSKKRDARDDAAKAVGVSDSGLRVVRGSSKQSSAQPVRNPSVRPIGVTYGVRVTGIGTAYQSVRVVRVTGQGRWRRAYRPLRPADHWSSAARWRVT